MDREDIDTTRTVQKPTVQSDRAHRKPMRNGSATVLRFDSFNVLGISVVDITLGVD